MHIKISFTGENAEDLSYLVNKNSGKVYEKKVSYGNAMLFFPEYEKEKATIVLSLELDPINIVRKSHIKIIGLDQYVNDRPYVVSSILCSIIPKFLNDAMKGVIKEDQKALNRIHDTEILISALRAKKELIEKIFLPLDYNISIRALFDKTSKEEELIGKREIIDLYEVVLTTKKKLSQILNELYILIQVLDEKKHYYISEDEVRIDYSQIS